MITAPDLLADVERALVQCDDVVFLNTETDLLLLGHLDRELADLVTRPYEPGALQRFASEQNPDGGAR